MIAYTTGQNTSANNSGKTYEDTKVYPWGTVTVQSAVPVKLK